MADLVELLLETGILQFGRFAHAKPYQLQWPLLPSYPDVLHMLVDLASDEVGTVDHLVCALDSLPLALGLSLQTQIPLVYSRDSGLPPAHDLVGAYDIGHPAVLIANQFSPDLPGLIQRAGIVGLEINRMLVIMDEGIWPHAEQSVVSLLQLPVVIDQLVQVGRLPPGQADAVRAWITRHPG
jgi:hypothetical protein